MTIAALCEDHREIRALASAFMAMTERIAPPSQEEVATGRWKFTRELGRHLSAEEAFFRGLLTTTGDAAVRESLEGHLRDALSLRAALVRHNGEWTIDAVMGNWPAYCTVVREHMKGMFARFDAEERRLYPMAGRLAFAAETARRRAS